MNIKSVLARAAAVVATAGLFGFAGVAAASASPVRPHSPARYMSVTFLSDRPDSGGNGNWAEDAMARIVTYQFTGMTGELYDYTAYLSDCGSFTTVAGAFTPNQGAPYTGDVINGAVPGYLDGSASFSFTASAPIDSSAPNLGVPTSERGAPVNPDQTTSLWYEQAFAPGTVFGGPGIGVWGWHYTARVVTGHSTFRHTPILKSENWADTSSNGDGQLPADGNISGR